MKIYTKKIVVIGVVLFFALSYFYQLGVERQELELKIKKLETKSQEYEQKLKTCIPTSIFYQKSYSGDPRTNNRLTEVAEVFNKIVNAPCFKTLQDEMLSNPYSGIKLGELGNREHSSLEEEVFQGFLYEYDKGVPFLRSGWTLCEDGSLSGSVGRGTCSWHGGYARQRGQLFRFEASEKVNDPREKLARLIG
jgi:hypothetical protein